MSRTLSGEETFEYLENLKQEIERTIAHTTNDCQNATHKQLYEIVEAEEYLNKTIPILQKTRAHFK